MDKNLQELYMFIERNLERVLTTQSHNTPETIGEGYLLNDEDLPEFNRLVNAIQEPIPIEYAYAKIRDGWQTWEYNSKLELNKNGFFEDSLYDNTLELTDNDIVYYIGDEVTNNESLLCDIEDIYGDIIPKDTNITGDILSILHERLDEHLDTMESIQDVIDQLDEDEYYHLETDEVMRKRSCRAHDGDVYQYGIVIFF